MKTQYRWLSAALLGSLLGFTTTAMATTGYFALGYGAKSMGRAGAVISSPQDSIAAASNPAGMALVGERADVGLRFFSPVREAKLETSVVGAGAFYGPAFDVEDKSRRDLFLIPNLGFTKKVNDEMWWGISIYGNGGMNTTYDSNLYDETAAVLGAVAFGVPGPTPPPPLACHPTGAGGAPTPAALGLATCAGLVPEGTSTGTRDTGTLGVDLAQAIIAPTVSFRLEENHTFGISLLIGVQRFSARGLGNFQCFTSTASSNPANAAACGPGGMQALTPGFVFSDGLTNNGNEWSYGAGSRIGWIGDVHPRLRLGAAASSKVYMTKFDDYDELFADDGSFDIPASVSAGATFKATPKLSLTYDYQKIFYENVEAISNPGPIPTMFGPGIPPGTTPLGSSKGLGFGWENVNIHRIAAEFMPGSKWAVRGGFAWNDQPIPSDQILFNFLAPAVIEKHATLGFSYMPNNSSEWSFAYMHALKEEVKTSMSAFGIPAEIEMHQNSVDLSYALKF